MTLSAKSTPSDLNRGYSIAFVTAIVLASTGILIRHLTNTYQIPALVLAFWRDTFTALTLALILRVFKPGLLHLPKSQWAFGIGFGFCLAIFNSLWTLSVAINGASVSTVLVYSSAAFTALLGWWLLKESLGWAKILAVVVSLGGCVLVAGAYDPAAWSSNVLGIFTGIASGLFYAVYSLLGRTAAQRAINPWTTLLYTFSFAAMFLLVFNLLPGSPLPGSAQSIQDFGWLGTQWAGWGFLLLLAAGPTLAGFGLYNVSLTYLPSSIANLIVTLEPVFTTAMAYFLFGETFTSLQFTGSLLVVGAVIFLHIHERIKEARAASRAQAVSV